MAGQRSVAQPHAFQKDLIRPASDGRNLTTMFQAIRDALLSVVFPHPCSVCGRGVEKYADGPACSKCWDETTIFTGDETLCAKCSQLLLLKPPLGEAFCHRCDGHFYDQAISVGLYERALAACVVALKSEPHIPARLRRLLAELFVRAPFYGADLIIPVPLSKARWIERGFNQAEVVAGVIADAVGIPIQTRVLVRRSHTPMHRAAMDRRARELTVENAFGVELPELVAGRSIILIDDVFTTGATVSGCAKVLKKTGADKVGVLTIARAR